MAQLSTVLPWTGATLDLKGKEKKARAKYSQDIGAMYLSIEAAAPLNEETRRAAFLDTRMVAPAFSLDITLEYNSARAWLSAYGESDEARQDRALCEQYKKETNGRSCASSEYEQWKEKNRLVSAAGISGPATNDWSLGGEVRLAHDRLEVYQDNLASETKDVGTSQIRLGGIGRWSPRQDLAFTGRGGAERRNTAEVDKARRCQDLPSTDEGISGQACEDILFLTDNPERKWTGYVELAATFVPLLFQHKVVPGGEVRAGIDRISDGARLRVSTSGFVTPVTSPVILRFGVGLEYVRALRKAPDDSYEAGDDWWIPFILTGAEF